MPSSAVVAGAAPVWVGARLAADEHRAQVVHTGPDALYLRSYDDVIGVVSRRATAIPCVIATRLESLDDLFAPGRAPRPGDEVAIGAGRVDLGDRQVRVGRYVDFAMPPLDPAQAPRMLATLEAATGESPQPAELDPAVLDHLRSRPAEALEPVLGRGSGLTPFGDDVVCGLLATLLALADPCAAPLADRTRGLAPGRTTDLSATLLRRAAAGDVLPAFARVVADLLDRPDRVPASTAHLRGVGHTSGAGMLLGLRLALDHTTTRSCCP